jgi:signal transduction histidine kinase/predicted RNA-binding protein with RPS1 domain
VQELSHRYPQGSIIQAQVTLVKTFEAVVVLDDGTPGFIRNRELSWSREPDCASEILQKGQRIKALVLGVDYNKGRLRLSLRQAERDPWKSIEQRYKIGQVIRCRITSLLRRVAFAELEPAVEGFIPLKEIFQSPPARIDNVLWINDTVDAVIMGIDPRRRRVSLSIRKQLANLENKATQEHNRRNYLEESSATGAPLIEYISAADRLALLRVVRSTNEGSNEILEPTPPQLRQILIADDDSSFRSSLRSLLETLGYEVQVVTTGEDAVEICSQSHFDLVLIDQKFKHGKLDGVAAIQAIQTTGHAPPMLMMTGLLSSGSTRELSIKVRKAGAAGILRKPVPLRLLVDRMHLIADGMDCWDEAITGADPTLSTSFAAPVPPLPRQANLDKAINEELVKVLRLTRSTAAILFHMELAAREVRVVAHAGAPLNAYDTGKYRLQASPVQDVIKQRLEVIEDDISHNPERFKYLNLTSYVSCLGVPVDTASPTSYALFLFHPEAGHFNRDDLALVKVSASHIGSIIDRDEIEQMVRRVQPLVFAGQTGFMLVHELNNRLGSVMNYASSLLMDHERIDRDVSAAMDARLRERIRNNTESLKDNAQEMAKIAGLYLGLTNLGNRELVQLNEVLQRAMTVLAPVAETSNVELCLHLDPKLPSTIAVGSWLEQAFVNVGLNAIQHINLAKGKGRLDVETIFATAPESLSLRVLFKDNGPGIHAQHLDHIFDLGFSTRTEGTGLGLFATRALLEALGGKVTVLSSVIFVGTTLMIELPLIVPSVEDRHEC